MENHGAYVSEMSKVTGVTLAARLITLEEVNGYISPPRSPIVESNTGARALRFKALVGRAQFWF